VARRFPLAVHIFFVRSGQVLLPRRFNTGYEDGNYSVPAGHLEGDETVVQAAIREAREEVGVTLAPDDVAVVGANCEPHKCDDLRWSPRDEPPANTIPHIRRALENYDKGVWFEEFGW
jgi:8-oxo-dGTP pyrophosphatase MutT (NUDIX family)